MKVILLLLCCVGSISCWSWCGTFSSSNIKNFQILDGVLKYITDFGKQMNLRKPRFCWFLWNSISVFYSLILLRWNTWCNSHPNEILYFSYQLHFFLTTFINWFDLMRISVCSVLGITPAKSPPKTPKLDGKFESLKWTSMPSPEVI